MSATASGATAPAAGGGMSTKTKLLIALGVWVGGMVLLFVIWNGWLLALFGTHGTGLLPGQPTEAMIERGPYRLSRNPLYVGLLVLYVRPEGDLRVPANNIDLAFAATRPEVRGSGAGLTLTAFALQWAHDHGYESITTDWRMVNLLSSRFWPRRGFRPIVAGDRGPGPRPLTESPRRDGRTPDSNAQANP